MESAEDDPVGFASLRSRSGYHERAADQASRPHGAGHTDPGAVGVPTGGEHHHHVSGNTVYGRPKRFGVRYHHNDDDTAPFDVAALLKLLNDEAAPLGDHVHNDYVSDDPPALVIDLNATPTAKLRTHYYGDDCPGGHYDSEHPGPDDDDDIYWTDDDDYCPDNDNDDDGIRE